MKTIDIVLILAFILLCFFICDKAKAESATIMFTDEVDLEARVDSIGAVCDTVISSKEYWREILPGSSYMRTHFIYDTTRVCRHIEWVAVTQTPHWFRGGCVPNGKALVRWREETK